jgi:predicted GIY-YIG superfamily endonuclease
VKPIVYLIRFEDGASYVGATTNFSSRRRDHLRVASGGRWRTSSKLDQHLLLHPAPSIRVVASAFSRETLHLLEADVISSFSPTLNTVAKPTRIPHPKDFKRLPRQSKPKQMPQPPRNITAGGKTRTLTQWANLTGLQANTIRARLNIYHWTPEQAVGLELHPYFQNVVENKRKKTERQTAKATRPPKVVIQIDFMGHSGPIKEVAAATGLSYGQLYSCLKRGVDPNVFFRYHKP